MTERKAIVSPSDFAALKKQNDELRAAATNLVNNLRHGSAGWREQAIVALEAALGIEESDDD